VVTDRALMRAGLILVFLFSAFLDAGCSQGVNDRCVQNSDCASGICSVQGQSAQGGKCLATVAVPTTTDAATTGTGGSGGEAGQGGASGEGGNGPGGSDGAADAAQDASRAGDANPG